MTIDHIASNAATIQLIVTILSRTRGTIPIYGTKLMLLKISRGLPIGFITRLEARLAETEEALFRLVQSYEEPGNDQISLKPSSQRKDERIKEWDSLPLQSVEEVKAWYRNRAGQSGSSMRQDVSMVLDQQETPSRMTAPGEDHIDLDDAQDVLGTDIALSDPEVEVDSRREAQTPRVTDKGKAKEMEQKHPHMYF